jgi:hypothetical protein
MDKYPAKIPATRLARVRQGSRDPTRCGAMNAGIG